MSAQTYEKLTDEEVTLGILVPVLPSITAKSIRRGLTDHSAAQPGGSC